MEIKVLTQENQVELFVYLYFCIQLVHLLKHKFIWVSSSFDQCGTNPNAKCLREHKSIGIQFYFRGLVHRTLMNIHACSTQWTFRDF